MKANWRLVLISFLAMLILIAAGCVNNSNTTTLTGDSTSNSTSISTQTSTTSTIPTSTSTSIYTSTSPSSTTNTSTSLTTELPYRTDSTMTLSATPKLNKTVDLIFTINVIKSDTVMQPAAEIAKSKAWIDFYWTNIHGSYSEAYSSVQIPSEKILVGGELPWGGSYSSGLTLHSKIKLPDEGIWSIRSRFYGEGWQAGAGREINVVVADGMAAIMGTDDFKNGPLAYLGNLNYEGGVWPPYVPYGSIPVSLGLDISKAPRPGEEVILSCRINSIIDVPDFSLQWSFYRRVDDTNQKIPEIELLSSADLSWKTDIKKDIPAVFSTTFKFPTEGDWEIIAVGKSEEKILQYGHRMKISITSTRSSFGWAERPYTNDSEPTGTTAITTKKATGPSITEPQAVTTILTSPGQWYQYDNDTKKITPADSTTLSKLP
jgi:hypothetical protein